MKKLAGSNKRGFTLIELLVVVSIIALLVSILLPSLSRAREQTKQVLCLSYARQFGQALVMYALDNREQMLAGRWENGGDYRSINSWYSNLTPWLDPDKKWRGDITAQPNEVAKRYNEIWNKMICPAERQREAKHGVSQGVDMLTYAYHYAGLDSGHTFDDGYGLFDWITGRSRKLIKVKNASEMMAFSDHRDNEYTFAGHFYYLKNGGIWDEEWFMPARHPGGFCVTYVDGHGGMVKAEVFRDETLEHVDDLLWRSK